jgi:hypothetical protein
MPAGITPNSGSPEPAVPSHRALQQRSIAEQRECYVAIGYPRGDGPSRLANGTNLSVIRPSRAGVAPIIQRRWVGIMNRTAKKHDQQHGLHTVPAKFHLLDVVVVGTRVQDQRKNTSLKEVRSGTWHMPWHRPTTPETSLYPVRYGLRATLRQIAVARRYLTTSIEPCIPKIL